MLICKVILNLFSYTLILFSQSFHTIGVEFLNKDVVVGEDVFTMQIWDTAGQERFKSLRTPFYRGTDCCLLTFDVNDAQSFHNISMWKKEFLHYADVRDPANFPFVLIGNKVDKPDERMVKNSDVQAWCAENNSIPYFETSAKDNVGVTLAFVTAAELLKKSEPEIKTSLVMDTVKLDAKSSSSKSSCC